MATNIADITRSELPAISSRSSFEHRFFMAVAIIFPLITVIGFVPNHVFDTPLKPPAAYPLLIAHGVTMSLWIVLFSVQATLISAKKIRLHMTLGIFGVGLAALMIPLGVMTGYVSAARGSGFPGFTPEQFFIIPIGDMITFAILFGAAIWYRKNAAAHKRLMLVTVLNFLPPSTARLPLPFIPDLGAIWLFGVPTVIGLILLFGDTYRTGRLNRQFAAGLALMMISGPLRVAICRTDAWHDFVTRLIS